MITTQATSSSDSDQPDVLHTQIIPPEMVEYLREHHILIITTGTIKKITAEMIEEALKSTGVIQKVEEHDTLLNGLFRRLTQMGQLFHHADESITKGKK